MRRLLRTIVGLRNVWLHARREILREETRSQWRSALQLESVVGPGAARAVEPRAYAWLYRNDRHWLLATNAEAHSPPIGNNAQRVHRAQELVMGDGTGHAGNRHRLQPLEAAQLRVRGTQTIEHHRAHQCLGIKRAPGRAQRSPDGIVKAEARPQFVQGIHIAERQRGVVLRRRRRDRHPTQRALQAVNQRIQLLAIQLVRPPKIGDHALTHAGLGSKSLNDLQIAPAARAGNARVHVPTVADTWPWKNSCRTHGVTQHLGFISMRQTALSC